MIQVNYRYYWKERGSPIVTTNPSRLQHLSTLSNTINAHACFRVSFDASVFVDSFLKLQFEGEYEELRLFLPQKYFLGAKLQRISYCTKYLVEFLINRGCFCYVLEYGGDNLYPPFVVQADCKATLWPRSGNPPQVFILPVWWQKDALSGSQISPFG